LNAAPRVLYDHAALLDTAAVFALLDERDALHVQATQFFEANRGALAWYAVDTTAHESYTRVRYDLTREKAFAAYALLRATDVRLVRFSVTDEEQAFAILQRYADQVLSFQDALCAAVMRRMGIFKVFTFDSDFWTMGFQVIPGVTPSRR
jgi:predicted nucleic acid-binding protein